MNVTVEQMRSERNHHLGVREQIQEMLAAELAKVPQDSDYIRRLRNSVAFHAQRITYLAKLLRALKVAL